MGEFGLLLQLASHDRKSAYGSAAARVWGATLLTTLFPFGPITIAPPLDAFLASAPTAVDEPFCFFFSPLLLLLGTTLGRPVAASILLARFLGFGLGLNGVGI